MRSFRLTTILLAAVFVTCLAVSAAPIGMSLVNNQVITNDSEFRLQPSPADVRNAVTKPQRSTSSSGPSLLAITQTDFETMIADAARHLQSRQTTAGNWPWYWDVSAAQVSHETVTGYENLQGPILRSLLDASLAVNDTQYLAGSGDNAGYGAIFGLDWLLSLVDNVAPLPASPESFRSHYTQATVAMMQASVVMPGQNQYAEEASREYYDRQAYWHLDPPTTNVHNATYPNRWNVASEEVQYILVNRFTGGNLSQGFGMGLPVWDLAGVADGAVSVNDIDYAEDLVDQVFNSQTPQFISGAGAPPIPSGVSIYQHMDDRFDAQTPVTYATATAEVEYTYWTAVGHWLDVLNQLDEVSANDYSALRAQLVTTIQASMEGTPRHISYSNIGDPEIDVSGAGFCMSGLASYYQATSDAQSLTDALDIAEYMWDNLRWTSVNNYGALIFYPGYPYAYSSNFGEGLVGLHDTLGTQIELSVPVELSVFTTN